MHSRCSNLILHTGTLNENKEVDMVTETIRSGRSLVNLHVNGVDTVAFADTGSEATIIKSEMRGTVKIMFTSRCLSMYHVYIGCVAFQF